MEMFDNIVVKNEVDLDFIANFHSDENTQNSQNSAARPNNNVQSSTIVNSEEKAATNENGDENLQKLLKEFDLEILYTTLKLNDITYRSLRFLSIDDINTVIRNVAYRAEFREKLFTWRKNKHDDCNNDTILSHRGTQSMAANSQQMPTSSVFNNKTTPTTQHTSQTTITLPVTAAKIQHQQQTTFSNLIGLTAIKPTTKIVTPTTTPATIITRLSPCERNVTDDFLSLLPGVSGITKSISNTPTVILEHSMDLEKTLSSFIPKITIPSSVSTSTTSPATATITSSQQTSKSISPMSIDGHGHLAMGPTIMSCKKVHVQNVLQNTHVGRTITQFYNKNGYLENQQRNEIVRLIIEEVMQQGETLSPKDFHAVMTDIITLFPNEKVASDYYFIYRNGKGNPLGRLYQRYSNENSKRRKLTRLTEDEDCSDGDRNSCIMDDDESSSVYPQDMPGIVPRVDEMTALALKQLLTTDHFSWEEVCDKWIQTWALRQKELQQSGLSELLTNWVKLADPRAAELFKIDFRHVYPEKENLLFAKWDGYVKKISLQIDKKVNYDDIKKLYKCCKMGIASRDVQDFVHAIALTALLPSTGRFKDQSGKLKIRANIGDSIDSFVMRLNTLDAYESHLELYNRKYGPVNRTMHPFLVVISPNDLHISKIYVALDNHFYCMKSFLQALDLCYKIYHTCDLKYPTICENVWTFIQRYFYDMTVPWEARNANLASLIASMKVKSI